ncbi:MAG: hypothetical protein IJS31_02175 [Oscillospiraceae bacterium]|nr:hypothetical protein [Oscillospiraceae bacterium]
MRTLKKAERTNLLRQSISALKQDLQSFLNRMKGKYEFQINGSILEARLYNTGVREVLSNIGEKEASMLYHTAEIFKNARYLYSTPDYDGNPNIYRWNYFYTPVQIGNETVGVRIAVRDMVPSVGGVQESQIYHWGIKKDTSLGGGRPGTNPNTTLASSDVPNTIIPTSSEKSNSENLEDRTLPAPGKDSPSAAEGGSSPEGGAIAKRLTAPGMESVLALGESGTRGFQKTLADAERSGASVKQAAEAYARVYNAVLSGEDVQQAKQDAAKTIPQSMIEAAQAAAEADAERKAQAAYKGKDAILVRDKYLRKANLKSRDIRILDALAKVTGVQIRFVEQLGGGDYNASYKDGAIQIALDAKDPVRTAITHELIHRIRETAPEAYAQMARFVQQNMSELHLSEEMQRRAELYETTDPSRVSEETIADAFGYILGDSEALERMASQNRTLGQKIRDALHDLVQKIRTLLSGKGEKALDEAQRAMYRDLEGRTEEMARLFDAALEKVRANGETVIAKNNAEGYNENTKFSKKNTEGTVIRDFLRNYSGRVIEGDAVYLTRSELKRIGSAIKSGYAQFDIDGKTGSVSLEHFCYFFETVGNDVRVIDDIRNEELNIHKAVNEEEYSDGRADGNQAAYESVEAERNGQGDGAEHFVESADGKQSGKVDAVDERKTERYGDGSAGGVEKTSQRDITQNQEYELKASRKITTDPAAEIEAVRQEIERLSDMDYRKELLEQGGENAIRENRKKIDALQKRLDRLQGKPQQPSRRTAKETAKSKPVTSQKQLRQELISMFSVGDGSKRVVGMIVDEVAERMLREGRVDEDLRNALFSSLYASGVMTQEADEYYRDARSIVEGGKVYVSESVRADFGDDWPDFRKRAFAAGVYLTSDKGARGIDTRYKEAAEMFPGLFSEDELDMRTMLEQMVDVAEKGREKKVSLEEYNRDMAKRGYFTEEEVMTDLERQMDAALRKFADKAGLEVFLRDKTARELSAERQQRAETMRRQRETRELKEMQQKTLKQLQWLNRNRNKAPEELRGAIDDVLGDLDLYAVSAANEMNWSEKYQATWRDLAKMYKAAQANDPNFLPSKELEKIMSRISDPKIEDIDADTLSDLYRAAVALRTELYNRKNIIGEMEGQLFSEAYGDVTGELERVRDKRKGKAYNPKGAETFFNDEQLTPINVIERMAGWNPRSRLYEFGKQLVRGEQAVRAYEVEAKQMLAGFLEAHKDWVKRGVGNIRTYRVYTAAIMCATF